MIPIIFIAVVGATAVAQNTTPAADPTPAMAGRNTPFRADSGLRSHSGGSNAPEVLWSKDIVVPDAPWLRLNFESSELSGQARDQQGSFLLVTSLIDGATQILDANSVKQWGHTSAYMNGEAVTVQLVAYPNAGPSRVVVGEVTAGEPVVGLRSLCGPGDDRVLSTDKRVGRLAMGGSAYIINDVNHGLLTAGHASLGPGRSCSSTCRCRLPTARSCNLTPTTSTPSSPRPRNGR